MKAGINIFDVTGWGIVVVFGKDNATSAGDMGLFYAQGAMP
ncbi:hypothetical protein [Desulfuromonas acetoxidans]|nr:hypothetical protein [Desulfuromonas acetoxidans]